jgi:hypothetical protein
MTLRSIFAVLAVSSLVGCAVNADRADTEGDVDGDEAAASKSPAYTFYRVRRDFRKCMFPMCGGVYYRQVNVAKTNCVGGGSAEWCYAAEWDFSAVKSPELENAAFADTAIVRATIGKKTINGDKWATFNVYEGYKAITETPVTETFASVDPRFYLVKDNGIRCITAPCFSTDALRLNTSFKTTLSGYDLSGIAGADLDQLDAVAGIMVNSGVVLFGTIKGTDRVLAATQAYLKVTSDPNFCTDDSQCTLSTYTQSVTSKSECYCPMCPQPMTTADASLNAAGFAKYCSSTDCPVPSCARPPGVACVSNRCSYASFE